MARADVVSALALPNPMAEGAVLFHLDGRAPDLELNVTENLSRLIFLPLRSGAAHADLDAAKLSTAASVIDIAFEARAAYYRFVASKQIVELRKTVLQAAKASEEAAGQIHEAGNSTDLDLAGEQALYEEARLSVADAEANLATDRERLSVAMGFWRADTNWITEARLVDPPKDADAPPNAERRALSQSLDLEIARRRFSAAAKRANLARTEGVLPQLRAGASFERESDEATWGIGPAVGVEIPIFYQGQGEVARARAEMRRQEQTYASLGVQIRGAARSAVTRLEVAAKKAVFFKDTMLPLRVVSETQLHYSAMGAGIFQLLQAKRDQVETARAYVESLRDYWLARAELEQLLAGRLVRAPRTRPRLVRRARRSSAAPNTDGASGLVCAGEQARTKSKAWLTRTICDCLIEISESSPPKSRARGPRQRRQAHSGDTLIPWEAWASRSLRVSGRAFGMGSPRCSSPRVVTIRPRHRRDTRTRAGWPRWSTPMSISVSMRTPSSSAIWTCRTIRRTAVRAASHAPQVSSALAGSVSAGR